MANGVCRPVANAGAIILVPCHAATSVRLIKWVAMTWLKDRAPGDSDHSNQCQGDKPYIQSGFARTIALDNGLSLDMFCERQYSNNDFFSTSAYST